MTGMLGNDPRRHWGEGCGGPCCNSKSSLRQQKKAVRMAEKRDLGKEVREDSSTDDASSSSFEHVYDGERCICCGVNLYDMVGEGRFGCIEREPITYTTETPR